MSWKGVPNIIYHLNSKLNFANVYTIIWSKRFIQARINVCKIETFSLSHSFLLFVWWFTLNRWITLFRDPKSIPHIVYFFKFRFLCLFSRCFQLPNLFVSLFCVMFGIKGKSRCFQIKMKAIVMLWTFQVCEIW